MISYPLFFKTCKYQSDLIQHLMYTTPHPSPTKKVNLRRMVLEKSFMNAFCFHKVYDFGIFHNT